jgi:hypothetical protein
MDLPILLTLMFSGCGILFFGFAINSETKIINQLIRIKKAKKWYILRGLTLFFTGGYIMEIIAIVETQTSLLYYLNAFVFLFGAIFVVMIILISEQTYRAIFEVAENNLDADLEFNVSKQ